MRRRLLVNINLYRDLVYGNANYQFLDQPEELALPNQTLMCHLIWATKLALPVLFGAVWPKLPVKFH